MEMKQVDKPRTPAAKASPTLTRMKRRIRSFKDLRLRTRLIILVLAISIPLIVISIVVPMARTEPYYRQMAIEHLQQTNQAVFYKMDQWLTMNRNALNQLAALEDITSMDPARQKPVAVSTSKVYGATINTTGPDGVNLFRSDGQPNQNLSDRPWFKAIYAGQQASYQVLVTRATNKTSLNISVPIKDPSRKTIGVVSMVADLTSVSKVVLPSGKAGSTNDTVTFVVDQTDKVIAHPDTKIAADLTDYSKYPPVVALRTGRTGEFEFTDNQGRSWFAYLTLMDNGWGIITLQDSAKALAPVQQFRLLAWLILVAGTLVMVGAIFVMVSVSLKPVDELTVVASKIAAGDLNQMAVIRRNDEIGILAQTFNLMTAQLRENIGNLEQRVVERTRALTLSLEISRSLSTLLSRDDLMHEVVNQVQRSLNYYHVQIYLFDEARAHLEMLGGTGEAGQVMLTRGHKIPVGRGLVGRAAETKTSILVSDTLQDPDWLSNPLLPETRSELAVPFSSGGQVIGVLDVQQNLVSGLTQLDVQLVETVANQVGIALQNAEAFTRAQQQASYEGHVASIGQKIQRTTSIEEALQVAVSELGRALNAQRSSIELRSSAIPERKN